MPLMLKCPPSPPGKKKPDSKKTPHVKMLPPRVEKLAFDCPPFKKISRQHALRCKYIPMRAKH